MPAPAPHRPATANPVYHINLAGPVLGGDNAFRIQNAISKNPNAHWIIDCSKIQRVENLGLDGIIAGWKQTSARGGTFFLYGVAGRLLEKLHSMNLDTLLIISSTLERAKESIPDRPEYDAVTHLSL